MAIWKNHFVLDFGISYKLVQGVPMLFTEGHSLLVQPLEWAVSEGPHTPHPSLSPRRALSNFIPPHAPSPI